jgi:flagellar basal-body rod protein FlgC
MMLSALDISTSALVAQRTNLDTIAGNIANMYSTRGEDGQPGPYRRRVALFAAGDPSSGKAAPGVHVAGVVEDPSPFRLEYNPAHPDAIKEGENQGYVQMPNVEASTEMINMMMAARAYEANVTVIDVTKTMMASSLRMLI